MRTADMATRLMETVNNRKETFMTPQAEFIANSLMTPDDVAKLLNISRRSVLNLARSKRSKLTRYHFGRVVRFKPSDVEAFMERNKNA